MQRIEVVPVFLEILDTHITDEMVQSGFSTAFYGRVSGRLVEGMRKYGKPLTTHNGRDSLMDAWEEACDGVQYLTQAYCEGRLKNPDLIHDQVRILLALEEELIGASETDNGGPTESDEGCLPCDGVVREGEAG